MSKFTTQSYHSIAVKLLHCSITDTPIIHNTIQPRSEKIVLSHYTVGPTEIGNRVCDVHCHPINWKFN